MRTRPFDVLVTMVLTLTALTLAGCSQSRAETLRDRSASVERKLLTERDRLLVEPGAGKRDSGLSHLQSLRLALSMVNVSIASVPLMLTTEDERAVGYSVLDEALGTIDWNIPLYDSASSTTLRPYPVLFSPQTGLNFADIRRGTASPAGRP